jgi:hypothetical protein
MKKTDKFLKLVFISAIALFASANVSAAEPKVQEFDKNQTEMMELILLSLKATNDSIKHLQNQVKENFEDIQALKNQNVILSTVRMQEITDKIQTLEQAIANNRSATLNNNRIITDMIQTTNNMKDDISKLRGQQ